MYRRTQAAKALGSFLKENGITLDAAAVALSTGKSSIYQWIHGSARPRVESRQAIASWTSGAVPVADWLTKEEREAVDVVAPFVAAGRTGTAA